MSPRRRLWVLVPSALILRLVLAACGMDGGGLFGGRGRSFSANGERFSFTAPSDSGDPIPYIGSRVVVRRCTASRTRR